MTKRLVLKNVRNSDGQLVQINAKDTELKDVPLGYECTVVVCGVRVKRNFKVKQCLYCGKPILPRYFKRQELGHWQLITNSKFNAVKFCDTSCSTSYNNLERFSAEESEHDLQPIDRFLRMRLV